MPSLSISPRAPARHHLPAVALLGLLLVLTISHVYPQMAFPLHGAGLALGIFLLAALMGLAPDSSAPEVPRADPLPPRLSPLHVALVLQGAWVAWNYVALLRAPVAAIGRHEFATVLLGFFVFFLTARAIQRWHALPPPRTISAPAGDASPPAAAGEAATLSPCRIVVLWWMALAVGLSAYAIYQIYGPSGWPKTFATLREWLYHSMPGATESDRTIGGVMHALMEKRAFATFGAPNVFAAFLVPALAFATHEILAGSRRRIGRIGGAALAGTIIAFALILTQSRGGMLAAGVAVAWVAFRRIRGKIQLGIAAAACLAALLVCGLQRGGMASIPLHAAASVGALDADTPASPASPTPPPGASAAHRTWWEHLRSASTGRQRVYYWQTALALWGRHPIAGAGAGGYEVFYPQLRRPGAGETVYAHNWILQYGSETGAIGLLLFVVATAFIFRAGSRAERIARADGTAAFDSDARTGRIPALQAAALGLLVHGLLDYTLAHRELYLDFQLLLGVLCGLSVAGGERPAGKPDCSGAERRRIALLLRAAIVVISGIFVYYYVVCPMGTRFYALAARSIAEDAGYRAEAIPEYRKALAWTPDDPWIMAHLGVAELDEGDPRGLDRIVRATRLHPYSASLQSMLARAYDHVGSPDAALDAARRAVALHPLNPDHRIALAERLLARGRASEAREHLLDAAGKNLLPATRNHVESLLERIGGGT